MKTARIQSPFNCQNYAFRKGDRRPLSRKLALDEITFPSGLIHRWKKIRDRVRALLRARR